MNQRKMILKGQFVGHPLLASVDCQNERVNKQEAIQVVGKNEKAKVGYKGYLFETETLPQEAQWITEAKLTYLLGVEGCKTLEDYDVVTIDDYGVVRVRYRADSGDNVIFITNNCNSNCIMCPDSEGVRQQASYISLAYLKEYISLIPDDTPHLTITGGEPTLLKDGLMELIELCKKRFENTSFLMLTNGRTLSNQAYANKLIAVKPEHFHVAIPLYSYNANVHDAITRVPHSFVQAKKGIRHIAKHMDVEIRVVVMQSNYKDLPHVAQMLAEEFSAIKCVSFMGLELLGNAAIHQEQIWVDYNETAPYIETAAYILLAAGIEPRIYNYPLCSLPESLWSIAVKSITDYKVRYKETCNTCCAQSKCGGFFFSTINYKGIQAKPIVREK